MLRLIRELECLNCSNKRFFVHHTVSAEHMLTQAAAAALPRSAELTCGHCGGKSLVVGMGDNFPYRGPETIQRRRCRSHGAAVTTAGTASNMHGAAALTTAVR